MPSQLVEQLEPVPEDKASASIIPNPIPPVLLLEKVHCLPRLLSAYGTYMESHPSHEINPDWYETKDSMSPILKSPESNILATSILGEEFSPVSLPPWHFEGRTFQAAEFMSPNQLEMIESYREKFLLPKEGKDKSSRLSADSWTEEVSSTEMAFVPSPSPCLPTTLPLPLTSPLLLSPLPPLMSEGKVSFPHWGEPSFTNYTLWKGTLDYIFWMIDFDQDPLQNVKTVSETLKEEKTLSLHPKDQIWVRFLRVLTLPSVGNCLPGLPNSTFPSDHLALMAEVELSISNS